MRSPNNLKGIPVLKMLNLEREFALERIRAIVKNRFGSHFRLNCTERIFVSCHDFPPRSEYALAPNTETII